MLKKRLLWTAVILLAIVGAVTGHIDRASEEQAEDAARILKREMEGAASLAVPLVVDVGIGPNWLDAKA